MTPEAKRKKILTLLDHWLDFFDIGGSGKTATASDGVPILSISSMSHEKPVVELARLLESLRSQGPAHFAALRAYFEAPWRTTDRPVRRKTVGGKQIWEAERVRERVLQPPLVEHTGPNKGRRVYPACCDRMCGCGLPRPVCTAISLLAMGWDDRVACELPAPLRAKLTTCVHPQTGEEIWTERRSAA